MEQVIYADVLFLIDISMDFLALYITAKALKLKVSNALFILSAAIGALFSVFTVIAHRQSLLLAIVVSIAMCIVAFIGCKIKTKLICIGVFYGVNMLLGGAMTVIFNLFNTLTEANRHLIIEGESVTVPSKMPLTIFYIGFIAAVILIKIAFTVFERRPKGKPLTLEVNFRGKKTNLTVIEDSGNRLIEPISGEPIIFLKQNAIERVADRYVVSSLKMESEFYGGSTKEKFRVVIFDTVNGKDMCVCTRLGELKLEGNKISAWVALGKSLNKDHIDGIVPSTVIS